MTRLLSRVMLPALPASDRQATIDLSCCSSSRGRDVLWASYQVTGSVILLRREDTTVQRLYVLYGVRSIWPKPGNLVGPNDFAGFGRRDLPELPA